MTVIFRAKTQEAYAIKILAELLANNIKTGCFELDKEGINLLMVDTANKTSLIVVKLFADNFKIYRYNGVDKMYLGINLTHFHRMLSSIKKKDALELYIDDENINDLCIKIVPKENTRSSVCTVKIQEIQNISIGDIPEITTKPILISSIDFQKTIKEMSKIGKTISITSSEYLMQFNCNAGGILKKKVDFGESEDDETSEETEVKYNQEFYTEQLYRLTKISGLNSNMHIYPQNPLLIRSNIGDLGYIQIFIKTKEVVDEESRSNSVSRSYNYEDEDDE